MTRQTKVTLNYVAAQKEICPKTEKMHIQICLIVSQPIEKAHWIKLMKHLGCENSHVQPRKHGNSQAARDYCLKNNGEPGDRAPGTEPVEEGEWRYTESATGQGERADASAVYAYLKENPDKSYMDALEDWEGTPSFHFLVANKKFYMESQLYFQQQKSRQELVAEHAELTLYGWQTDVLSILSRSAGPPDRRLIDVIVDKYGGHGKSQLSSILSTSHGFISLSLGKRDDLLHAFVQAYQSCTDVRGVVIDIPMSAVTCGTDSRISIWQVAEMLKNRLVTSNKYASATFFLPRMHVVIMTNQDVPTDAFGANRLRIHHLEQTALGMISRRVELR